MTYLVAFLGGLAGSMHCVGMCGVFPLALASAAPRHGRLAHQLLYHLGRLNVLLAIGALSGAAGSALVATASVAAAARGLAIAAGAVMIVTGLELLGVIAWLTPALAAAAEASVGRLLAGTIRSSSAAAPLALGVFNAFLPCQLIYAFAARAAATASARDGMLTMAAFGLGTVPAMTALGMGAGLARRNVRAGLTRAAGIAIVAFGAVTVLRGVGVLPHAGHVHGF
jgi:sulfite exporter TauE/SafE